MSTKTSIHLGRKDVSEIRSGGAEGHYWVRCAEEVTIFAESKAQATKLAALLREIAGSAGPWTS